MYWIKEFHTFIVQYPQITQPWKSHLFSPILPLHTWREKKPKTCDTIKDGRPEKKKKKITFNQLLVLVFFISLQFFGSSPTSDKNNHSNTTTERRLVWIGRNLIKQDFTGDIKYMFDVQTYLKSLTTTETKPLLKNVAGNWSCTGWIQSGKVGLVQCGITQIWWLCLIHTLHKTTEEEREALF